MARKTKHSKRRISTARNWPSGNISATSKDYLRCVAEDLVLNLDLAPTFQEIIRQLKVQLRKLRDEYGDSEALTKSFLPKKL
ncbi:MAG: hypothetical protein ONB46_07785 [candidate division KSB1 bacterium]|nr:hypothetical protein [candidate division KSB1 bacterium]MDZ7365492.1 hypothetical protein [candidate division KSB1 bacterium]MDZ7403595.1 hypothetical protein [candidate division KSB1 bacterium]